MEGNIPKVEAVLFAIGKEVTVERIANLCSLKVEEVKSILIALEVKYQELKLAYHLVSKENGWKLTVKDAYIPLVSSIVSSTELERPLMETLAVIAWRYPIMQSDVVKLRNASAYEHMKKLEEQGFIAKEKSGRTFKLKLTKKFFEYFDLPSEEAKQAFLKNIPQQLLQEAETVNTEADRVERLIELGKKEGPARDDIKKAIGEIKG